MNEVARVYIDKWIDKNGPDGLVKLALLAGVSSSFMSKVRNGIVPAKQSTRLKICGAMNLKETSLFPLVGASGNRSAS